MQVINEKPSHKEATNLPCFQTYQVGYREPSEEQTSDDQPGD